MREETIQNSIQRRDIGQIDFENETIFPRDSMALHDLRYLLCQVGDFGKLSWQGTDSYKCRQGVPQCGGVELKSITGYDAVLLQTRNPFRHRGTRHFYPSCQFGHRRTRACLQNP